MNIIAKYGNLVPNAPKKLYLHRKPNRFIYSRKKIKNMISVLPAFNPRDEIKKSLIVDKNLYQFFNMISKRD